MAARAGQTEVVRYLVQNGAQVEAKAKVRAWPTWNRPARSLLGRAGTHIHLGCVIREAKPLWCPLIFCYDDQTPLHISARLGKADIVQQLLQQGASPTAATTSGYTPLHLSAREGHEDVMDIATTLLEYGADANAVTRQGIAPLHLASQDGHVDMVSLLLARSANVSLSNKVGVPLPGVRRRGPRSDVLQVSERTSALICYPTCNTAWRNVPCLKEI
uniref:Uncharacterized protein n=1 Tax=Junco hyemalis TaxID=40217 RepID=A0A8C5IC16_JUNHY